MHNRSIHRDLYKKISGTNVAHSVTLAQRVATHSTAFEVRALKTLKSLGVVREPETANREAAKVQRH